MSEPTARYCTCVATEPAICPIHGAQNITPTAQSLPSASYTSATLTAEIAALRADVERLTGERDAMKAVVEAARGFRRAAKAPLGDPAGWSTQTYQAAETLFAALAALAELDGKEKP